MHNRQFIQIVRRIGIHPSWKWMHNRDNSCRKGENVVIIAIKVAALTITPAALTMLLAAATISLVAVTITLATLAILFVDLAIPPAALAILPVAIAILGAAVTIPPADVAILRAAGAADRIIIGSKGWMMESGRAFLAICFVVLLLLFLFVPTKKDDSLNCYF